MLQSKDKWLSQGIFETAIVMIKDFNIAIDDVVEKLNIRKEEELKDYIYFYSQK